MNKHNSSEFRIDYTRFIEMLRKYAGKPRIYQWLCAYGKNKRSFQTECLVHTTAAPPFTLYTNQVYVGYVYNVMPYIHTEKARQYSLVLRP